MRHTPFPNVTASSWLELTNPSEAAKAPPEYGDVVTLEGTITTRQDKVGNTDYVLVLKQNISIPPSADAPAEDKVCEIHLNGFDQFGGVDSMADARKGVVFHVSGTLGHSNVTDQIPVVTLKVHGYDYGKP